LEDIELARIFLGCEPSLRIKPSARWRATDIDGAVSARNGIFNGEYRNFLQAQPDLKPEELWNIDTKIDDAKPGTGKLVVFTIGATNLTTCTTSSVAPYGNDVGAQYLLSSTQKLCGVIFKQAW
jgi:hypothetical protein